MTSFRKYNILQAKLQIPYKDSNAYSSVGRRLGKRACWCLHKLSPGVLYISGDRSCMKVFVWMFGSHVSRLVGNSSPLNKSIVKSKLVFFFGGGGGGGVTI